MEGFSYSSIQVESCVRETMCQVEGVEVTLVPFRENANALVCGSIGTDVVYIEKITQAASTNSNNFWYVYKQDLSSKFTFT